MTYSKNFLSLAVIILAALLTFTSCKKDNLSDLDNETTETSEGLQENGTETGTTDANTSFFGLVNGGNTSQESTMPDSCFTINYPITIVFPAGETQDVNSDEDLETAIENWYESNEDLEEEPTLLFPINVTLTDGTTQSVSDEDTLITLFEDCYGDDDYGDEDGDDYDDEEGDWDCDEDDFGDISDCFTINYPIEVTTSNGAVTVNSDEEFDALFEGLDEEEEVEITFPVSITLTEDGSTVEVNSEDEIDEIFENCFGEDYDDEDDEDGEDEEDEEEYEECFTISYPISLTVDGADVTVNSDDELDAAFDNAQDEDNVIFNYPIDLVLAVDGSTVAVNSDEEVDAIFDTCD